MLIGIKKKRDGLIIKGIVYGATINAAQNKLQEIINDYTRYNIATIVHKHNLKAGDKVSFSNGDIWEACVASENVRGRACNVAYIDHRIDIDLLDIIMASIKNPPFQAHHHF